MQNIKINLIVVNVIDLIILVLIAYFIIRKLKSILGEESDDVYFGYGAQKNRQKIKEAEQIGINDDCDDDGSYNNLSSDAKMNLKAIRNRIQNFSLAKFQDISIKVLEYVIKANNERNKTEIKKFLSKELADLVAKSFESDEKNNIFLVSVRKNEIIDIIKTDEVFDIKVKFEIEQINYITDKNDNIIEGNKHDIIKVNEIWTFTHNFSEKESTWFVSKIEEI